MKKIKEVLIQRVSPVRKKDPLERQTGSHSKRNRIRFCIALKRKMRAAKMAPALPYMRVELYVEQAKVVTAARCFNVATTGYPVCPDCGYALVREYQNRCDLCGQLLGWKKYMLDELMVQRITGAKSQRENVVQPACSKI